MLRLRQLSHLASDIISLRSIIISTLLHRFYHIREIGVSQIARISPLYAVRLAISEIPMMHYVH